MTVYGLIDCNSFYCSCQRAFEPRLKRLPVVVLSNNDGCAIARTKEAKALGIKMGEPCHLVREQRKLSGVQWYSSNYPLYADMSRRVYQVLLDHAPRVEPYSIDEMFLDLTGLPGDLSQRCDDMRAAVEQITKIPTCVGWGPTKAIAKLANYIAKDRPEMEGLCDLTNEQTRNRFYRNLPVSEVWGIGRRLAARLDDTGIRTIAQFVNAPPAHIRKIAAIIGVRLQAELRGESCLQLSEVAAQRHGLACTRSFGRPITTHSDMSEAVTGFAVRASEKLRAEKLDAAHVSVFIQTNRHKRDEGWYANQASLTCAPTSNTLALTAIAMRLLRTIWKDGFRYAKAGVMLNDLAPAGTQHTLFDIPSEQDTALMGTMDAVNQRFGRGALRPLSAGVERSWRPRQNMLSPRFTTNVHEIMEASSF
ncbi:Y-family DNA polymerase [Acetobacter orientalis]|uniref:DNA-directed DNA polymerase n=1 Tax=Acetobacter orientalis TaxID=146474 RepID=A0A0D6NMS3_9PROT|nr:Y-family DNA polymerase [Acetobacter orientalis]GAN66925.1 DNA-repair DNA polymerase IV UmuC [Acetobacter orientalis]GBR14190.1 SOS mutagenesis protein UmuC [Acetobacter orientalis NRIC 0481]GEL60830.1 DNA polymerase V subunit UmuC [Acetobacter orientalis]